MTRLVSLVLAACVLSACAGRLVALEEEGEPALFSDCGFAILSRTCTPLQDTFAKCHSCSGFAACHGKDMPAIPGLDLTADGIGDGTKYVNRRTDDSVAGSCGAMAMPTPITGEVYIDPIHPQNSLIYKKVTATFGCGSRMPFVSTTFLSSADQQCILDWIKNVHGVSQGNTAGDDGSAP